MYDVVDERYDLNDLGDGIRDQILKNEINNLKTNIFRYNVTEELEAESEMILDFSYKSGNLEVFYCGERLIKDTDYEEVFDEGSETSNKLKILFDVPNSTEFPRYFDFMVKGVITNA